MLSCTIVGHKTYLGFLYLEHTYNNPVANTFVALLTDGGGQEDKHSLKGEQSNIRGINVKLCFWVEL